MAKSTSAYPHNRTSGLDRWAARAAFTLLGAVQVTLVGAITVITVALPVIGRDLHLGESGLVLVSSGYGISFGGLLPAGGRLADRLGRRRAFVTVFAVPTVVAAIGVAVAPRLLPAGPAPVRGKADWPGAVLATTGLAVLIYGLQRSGWAVAAGAALLAAFALAERRHPAPLVPLPFLARRALPLAAVLACAAAMATAFFLLSLYLQQARGLSALRVSATFLLAAPAAVTAGPLAGRLIRRFGVRLVLAAGLLTAAAGLLLLSFLGAPYAGLLVFPFGAGLAFSAALVTAMQDAGGAQAGLAGALVAAAMETGPPLGLAVLTWAAATYSRDPAAGYPFALRTAAILLFALALFTTTGRRPSRPQEEK